MKTDKKVEVVTVNKVEVSKEVFDHLSTLQTTSSKIRYLDSKQFTRGQISKILSTSSKTIRYQHVRNVLITPITKQK
jgi:nicotinic acid phosphoribosyltransferase